MNSFYEVEYIDIKIKFLKLLLALLIVRDSNVKEMNFYNQNIKYKIKRTKMLKVASQAVKM